MNYAAKLMNNFDMTKNMRTNFIRTQFAVEVKSLNCFTLIYKKYG